MTDFEFMVQDRITKIRSINELYNLEKNAYVSFSDRIDHKLLERIQKS